MIDGQMCTNHLITERRFVDKGFVLWMKVFYKEIIVS